MEAGLRRKDIDIVDICTPGDRHAAIEMLRTLAKERPLLDRSGKLGQGDVDDSAQALVKFENGAAILGRFALCTRAKRIAIDSK